MRIAIISLVALITFFAALRAQNANQAKTLRTLKVPTEKPNRIEGVKALSVNAGRIPFTLEDVNDYIRTHRLAKNVGDPSQLQAIDLTFIDAGEVKKRLLGVSTGLPDKQRVGFATISGPIYIAGPPQSKTVHFERGYAIFDSKTGNLLMSGTLSVGNKSSPKPKLP
jgi:hypothetical protein